jgi:hypothetical protein
MGGENFVVNKVYKRDCNIKQAYNEKQIKKLNVILHSWGSNLGRPPRDSINDVYLNITLAFELIPRVPNIFKHGCDANSV